MRGSKARFPPPIPCPSRTSLCALMLFAWAQNVSSDETAGRPRCVPHPPTRPYLLLLGEDGRSACHLRVDTRSPDSSRGFIMLPPLSLFCISIVSCFLAGLRYCILLNANEREVRHKTSFSVASDLHSTPSRTCAYNHRKSLCYDTEIGDLDFLYED